MLRNAVHHFIILSIFRIEDESLPRMIEVSSKFYQNRRKEDVGLVEDLSELAEYGWSQAPPVSRVGKKNKPSVHSYTLFCTVANQAKQPVAEELIASDWAKIWCNLLGLVATNCPRENLWEYRTGWKVPRQDKCKGTHSSSKKENRTRKQSRLLLPSCTEACAHDSVWLVPRRLQHDHLASKLPVQNRFVT